MTHFVVILATPDCPNPKLTQKLMLFPNIYHPFPMLTSQGKELGQKEVATSADVVEGLLKSETENSITNKHQHSQGT